MGPPMDEERLQRMMEDPNVQQSMNEALNNPDFVNMLIQSNPMLRDLPNAREILTSPFMRQMMSNPSMISQAMRAQRNFRGAGAAFPAPGATDTTPADAAASAAPGSNEGNANPNNAQHFQDPFADLRNNPFANPFSSLGQEARNLGPQDLNAMAQSLDDFLAATRPANATGESNPTATEGGNAGTEGSTGGTQRSAGPAPGNPFAALFQSAGINPSQPESFGMNPEMVRQVMQMMSGGGAAAPAAPQDNRPPEERYADQLRQLNDMGFFDFDRNIAALRRSGGSVQGAVEYLLTSP